MNYTSLALFCGSSSGNNPHFIEVAKQFGQLCADKSLTLYYGGASIGIMGAAANAALAHHGKVIGIAPDFFTEGEVLATNLTEMILVKSMSERKQLMEQKADAFVIFPGAYGTMDELFEIITDCQLGLHHKPVVLFNPEGYYDHLIAQLERFSQDGFLRTFHKDLLLKANTLTDLFDKLNHYQNTNNQNWLSKIKKPSTPSQIEEPK